ncbi:MAG TPA: non-homologous end-joining DNA ligase [Tepidisphaeraceae bacterium]|nr:non-homologous end-joining DNA ligase [Tepidisphaeraceae bacterium]
MAKKQPAARPQTKRAATKRATKPRAAKSRAAGRSGAGAPPDAGADRQVQFTHVDKVMFPEAGITKGEVIEYYLKVADKLIPHLRDRPITLERMPDGVGDAMPRFWQKNTPPYYPAWIPRVKLTNKEGKGVEYALVNDAHTLAYLVNQGAITFHPFFSKAQDLDRPTHVVFDLDPGGAPFGDVVRIAHVLHDTLEGQGLPNFAKTSGKSGLHVTVPWRQRGGFDQARGWAMSVAEAVVRQLPKLATVERMKAARGGRVYVDVIQNAPEKHAVPPYVIRPTPQATVSTPLEWKEVTPKLDPKKFTLRTAIKRFDAKGDLMAPLAGGN